MAGPARWELPAFPGSCLLPPQPGAGARSPEHPHSSPSQAAPTPLGVAQSQPGRNSGQVPWEMWADPAEGGDERAPGGSHMLVLGRWKSWFSAGTSRRKQESGRRLFMQQQAPRALHFVGSQNILNWKGHTPSGHLLPFFHHNLFFCRGQQGREILVVVSPSSPNLMLLHDSLSQQETAVNKRGGLPRGTMGFVVPIYSYPAFPSSGMWVSKSSLGALLAHLGRSIARPQWKNFFHQWLPMLLSSVFKVLRKSSRLFPSDRLFPCQSRTNKVARAAWGQDHPGCPWAVQASSG